MREGRLFVLGWTALAVFLLVIAAACQFGPSKEELKAQKDEENWTLIEQAKTDLDQQRAELRDLEQTLAGAAPASAAEPAEAPTGASPDGGADTESPEALAARLEDLQQAVASGSEAFSAMLVEFINSQDIVVGEPLTERQRAAIRLKSDEEILIGREYIDKAGDYTRAIDIYKSALDFDSDNEKLQAELAKAEADRYMTKERFGQVKKKMTQNQVRALLGQVQPKLNRAYEKDDAVAWFYEKEGGGAAGVFFRESRRGRNDWKAYHMDWNAIKNPNKD